MLALVAPPPPSWDVLLTDWEPDVLLVVVALAAAGYALGVHRLARRGRSWPRRRSLSFAAGLAVVVIATQSGLAAYDRVLFSLHVVQHLLLGMVAALLLALAAPVTLALQASGRAGQQRLLRVLHSPPVRILTHPVTAWLLFGGTLAVLYFTGLYELSLRNDWVHAAVHAHFLVAGFLFLAIVVAVDPIPVVLGFGARLLYVLVALPFHAFLGVAILGSDEVIAGGWYDEVVRGWGSSPLADQRTGAGLLWVAGELFGLVAALVVVRRWMAHEERAGARHDRQLEAARTA
ncbi:MAG TPA: cytochrome c oxidase assembly protein [Acidimicrobiales bacterium]